MSMKLSAEMFNEIVSTLKSDGTCSRGHERRACARVGLRCTLDIVPCTFLSSKATPVTVHVHDISASGIGLVSQGRLAEDSEFVARLLRDGHPMVPVLYKVVQCRRLSNELFAIGAALQRILPDSEGEVLVLGKKTKAVKPKPEGVPTPAVQAIRPEKAVVVEADQR
jgi:hypothetical protein